MTISQKTMTTQDVANRLVELCRIGQIQQAQEELFSDDVSSIEPANSMSKSAKGKKAVAQKGAEFASMIEQRHGGTFSDPVISGNFFSAAMTLDATIKEKGRMTLEEICVYEVKDGKIITEQFFF
ncbi:MAG: nuclear transport factor 2 family protein [Saprospiraceae bacterium]